MPAPTSLAESELELDLHSHRGDRANGDHSSLAPLPMAAASTGLDADADGDGDGDANADSLDTVADRSRIADSLVPEGGYGWVVVGCSAVLSWWFVGTSYCWGVMEGRLVSAGVAPPSTLAFVGSLTVACIALLALVNARVLRACGSRPTALVAVTLLAGGEILSGFALSDVRFLFLTTGLVAGLGTSMCFMVVSVTPAQYFKKRRGLANGIVYAGGGLGGAVLSFAVEGLLQKLGPAWTFRVIGLLTLATGLPAAWFITERVPITTVGFVEWALFKDIRFVTLFIAGATATFPLFVPPFFLPLYASSLGLSTSLGAGLVAGFNLSSAIGRIGCGFLCDSVGPLNTLCLSLTLSAVSMLVLWPLSSSVGPLTLFIIINGTSSGGFFSSMPTVVANVFGSLRVSVAMGMIVSGWAGGYLMGAPIAGYILDKYGGVGQGFEAYRPAIFYAGSMALGAAGMAAFTRFKISPRLLERI